MRAMFVEFPTERAFDENDAEFMFGNDLLIAPKLTEQMDDIEIALPATVEWYDYWTGAPVARDAHDPKKPLQAKPALDQVPLQAGYDEPSLGAADRGCRRTPSPRGNFFSFSKASAPWENPAAG